MKSKKSNKLKMFNALTTLMESNNKIWSRVKEIERAYKSFLEGTNKLSILKDDYEKSLKHLITKKTEARKNLINKAIPIANVIVAFAIENKDKKLIKKCNFSKPELRKSKVLELVDKSKTVWKEAKKLYDKSIATTNNSKSKEKSGTINIHNYGLTGQMIDNLEIANVAFIETHLELKDAYVHKQKCGKKITSIIKTNNLLLRDKLDLLISVFKSSDPLFYKNYQDARLIHKSDKTKETKAKINKTAENKKEEVVKTNKEIINSKIAPQQNSNQAPLVVKNEVSKSEIPKPVVKKAPVRKSVVTKTPGTNSSVAKTPVKRPVRRKPVSKPKTLEVKKVADEPLNK